MMGRGIGRRFEHRSPDFELRPVGRSGKREFTNRTTDKEAARAASKRARQARRKNR